MKKPIVRALRAAGEAASPVLDMLTWLQLLPLLVFLVALPLWWTVGVVRQHGALGIGVAGALLLAGGAGWLRRHRNAAMAAPARAPALPPIP